MEDAGAGAVVLYSLFQEQLQSERQHNRQAKNAETNDKTVMQFPDIKYHASSDAYLEHIHKAKRAVSIPIIASLNGSVTGEWTLFAQKLEQAGADGIELNLYSIPANENWAPGEIELDYLTTTAWIKQAIKIPLAIKLSPFFTNLTYFAQQLDRAGVDALVLFNRFYQPDIDITKRAVYPHVLLSRSDDLRLPLRWISILYGRVKADLAATSGIHSGQDAIKALMAGANVTMLASTLIARGIDHLYTIGREMREWMERHEYDSVEQIKGVVSEACYENPDQFERDQYMQALTTYLPPQYKTDDY
jgi:dihydroorotate dehydrogenase (fumarate)